MKSFYVGKRFFRLIINIKVINKNRGFCFNF